MKLDKFDNRMIKFSGKIGEAYQHLTGKSYVELVKTMYRFAGLGYSIGTLFIQPNGAALAIDAFQQSKNPSMESPLEEEIRFEANRENKKSGKVLRAAMIPLSLVYLSLGSNLVSNSFANKEYIGAMIAAGLIPIGMSLPVSGFADYLSKAQIPKPPEKTVKDKLSEFFARVLVRLPVAVPSYV